MSESLQGDELASKVGSSPGWGKKGKWSKRGANLMGQRLRGIIRACTQWDSPMQKPQTKLGEENPLTCGQKTSAVRRRSV